MGWGGGLGGVSEAGLRGGAGGGRFGARFGLGVWFLSFRKRDSASNFS